MIVLATVQSLTSSMPGTIGLRGSGRVHAARREDHTHIYEGTKKIQRVRIGGYAMAGVFCQSKALEATHSLGRISGSGCKLAQSGTLAQSDREYAPTRCPSTPRAPMFSARAGGGSDHLHGCSGSVSNRPM